MPKKIIVFFILLFIISFFFFSNFALLKDVANPIGKDSLGHLEYTLTIIRSFHLSAFLKNWFATYYNVVSLRCSYPPLFYIVAALVRYFLNPDFMFMTSTLFLILLIYSTYKITTIIKDEKAGLLSVAIVSFYPIIYQTSRHFNLDMAQTAMVCLTICLLVQTKDFKDKRYSILFGVVGGIGTLSKHMFILFVIWPLLVVSVSLLSNFKQNRRQLRNLIVAILLFGLVSIGLYYGRYIFAPDARQDLLRESLTFTGGELDVVPGTRWFNLKHLLFYLKCLKENQIGLLNIILFLLAMPLFLSRKLYQKYRLFLISWIILPLILFTVKPGKYSEYIMPYLPAFAIITSLGILSIKQRFARTAIIVTTLLFNAFIYFGLTFPKYTDSILSGKISKTFLRHFVVSCTSASSYDWIRSKDEDSGYATVRLLDKLLKNKKSKIGLINYPGSEWDNVRIKHLLLLYNARYEVKNLIFDPVNGNLDMFDIIIFFSPVGRYDRWLDRDYLMQDIGEFNKILSRFGFNTYFLWDGVNPLPFKTIPVFQRQLEQVIDYHSKMELVQSFHSSQGDILVYRKLQ